MHTCSTRSDSLGFVYQHHTAAVLFDESNPREDKGLSGTHMSSQFGKDVEEKHEHACSKHKIPVRTVHPEGGHHVHEDP